MRSWCLILILAGLFVGAATASDLEQDRQSLLASHTVERQAHLQGDADLLAGEMADQVVNVEDGKVEVLTREEMRRQFAHYFRQVKYSSWDDSIAPRVNISPDGHMAWIVIEVKARLSDLSGPGAGRQRGFNSSWIATYEKHGVKWQVTGISSGVAEDK